MIEKSQARVTDEPRYYIGASSIGSDCLRQIWYQYKGVKAEEVPTKFRRTWAIGKKLEGLVVDWLKDAGLLMDLEYQIYRARNVPIFQGNLDGIVFLGKTKAILEIKTAKDSSFKIFIKKGIKVWNPQYYAQIQSYMGMSGIHSTYILVLNKDNSDLSDELVKFDKEFYEKLEAKALMISKAVTAPPRVHGSPLFYKCKMCKFNKTCHK